MPDERAQARRRAAPAARRPSARDVHAFPME